MATAKSKLAKHTTIVADTGEFLEIKKHKPQDATTNPSLLMKAAEKEEYKELVQDAVEYGAAEKAHPELVNDKIFTKLAVNFGVEILKIVPGRVSTEVPARLSFDTNRSVEKAREIISLYEGQKVDRKRILIKLASTWEGIRAAEILEKEGIHCNLTLMFDLCQAAAAAEAQATLISPFVGRILDWHKKAENRDFASHEDPGVLSVRDIYNYFKFFDYETVVMGASFRNTGEILELAGCDLLTISPKLLNELEDMSVDVPEMLNAKAAKTAKIRDAAPVKLPVDEASFRWQLNENRMATELLSDGIRRFYADQMALMNRLSEKHGALLRKAG